MRAWKAALTWVRLCCALQAKEKGALPLSVKSGISPFTPEYFGKDEGAGPHDVARGVLLWRRLALYF